VTKFGLDWDMTNQVVGEACEKLFDFDGSVRYVTLLGMDGAQVYSVGRRGVQSKEPQDETDSMFLKIALGRGLGESTNRYHGRMKSIIVNREKIKLLLFLTFDKILLISTEPEFPLHRLEELEVLVDTMQLED
jgi:hypothetical protein